MSLALFPGWRPEAEDQRPLASLLRSLQSARPDAAPALQPRRPDQWHATLCFIGYDQRHRVTPGLLDAFDRVSRRIPPHRFSLERVTYWPQSGAVVALPRDCPALQALCDATRDALRSQGIRPLQVTSQPHLTLAYLGRHYPPQPWLEQVACGDTAFQVDRFELLFNPGGRYESLAGWTLRGQALPPRPVQEALL